MFDCGHLVVGSGFGGEKCGAKVLPERKADRIEPLPWRRAIKTIVNALFAPGLLFTHILCGCPMGRSARDGVIDPRHEVHGHPGLFVVDGSSIPGNIGVNPGLTITAMAERFAALQPART